jgi:hypothetical protein
MPGAVFHALHELWLEREQQDEFFGTLVNEWIRRGGAAIGLRVGESYVDVGTLHGYREAIRLLSGDERAVPPVRPAAVPVKAETLAQL